MSPRFLSFGEGSDTDETRDLAARVEAAEARGRSIPPTPTAYEALPLQGGSASVAEALVARANRRWQNVAAHYPFAVAIVLPHLARLVPIDATLLALGVPYDSEDAEASAPVSMGLDWPGQLRWGADSTATAAKFLLVGQGIGAAAVLRQQVERWTENRAAALGLKRESDEGRADFYERVWGPYWEVPLSIRRLYRDASELLHGRGRMLPLIRWEAANLYNWPPPPEAAATLAVLARFATLPIQQVLACSMDLTRRAASRDLQSLLSTPVEN